MPFHVFAQRMLLLWFGMAALFASAALAADNQDAEIILCGWDEVFKSGIASGKRKLISELGRVSTLNN
jgi:hypothetical protein